MTTELEKQCEFFYKGGCDIYPMTCDYNNFCKQNEECFVKKILSELKAKEQECEKLKNKLAKSFADERKKEMFIDQLKADREEALKQLEFVRTLNTVQEAENRKLSKTLEEIKEIAEANKNYKFKITESVCIGDTLELKFDVLEQILNKFKKLED